MSDSTDSLIGQVIADRYQVLALLGEGGMGRVYLAEHIRMGRKSAVKVMSPNLALSADAISGDASNDHAPLASNDADRIRVIGGDIQGHMTRAEAFVREGDIPKARSEYRDAVPVLKILRELYFGTPAELQVEQMVRTAAAQSFQSCFQTMSDSAVRARMPPTFRCQSLIPPMMTGQGRGRGGFSPAP